MGTPDSKEYDRLRDRGFKPYSKGHREMYEKAIREMRTLGRPARVLEAGFGIGWGLDRMTAEGVLASYVGYEPNKDSYRYVVEKYGREGDRLFLNLPFEPALDPAFDYAVCIEVIEHVPMDRHAEFLRGLLTMAPVLFFSTPDIRKVPKEGVRTTAEWTKLLTEAGFKTVAVDGSEWTTFYRCGR